MIVIYYRSNENCKITLIVIGCNYSLVITHYQVAYRKLLRVFFCRIGVKNACNMLVALGVDSRRVYEEEFEEPFLRVSAEYYRAESQNFLLENCASVYVKKVEECLMEESNRAKMYLDKGTEQKILDVC